MPTRPDEESAGQDGPGDAGPAAVPADGLESFLSAVRGMVHGDDAPVVEQVAEPVVEPVVEPIVESGADDIVAAEVPADPSVVHDPVPPVEHDATQSFEPTSSVAGHPAVPSPREWVADEEASDWLPGTWVVDKPTAPRRRADRGAEKALARHEKKLREQELRNVRRSRKRRRGPDDEETAAATQGARDAAAPAARVPAQPDPATDGEISDSAPMPDRPGADSRRERRQRRRDAARAMTVSNESGADLVPSGPAPAVDSSSAGAKRSGRRDRRRAASGSSGAGRGRGDSGETPTVSGAMSETAPMSQLGTEGASTRRTSGDRRRSGAETDTAPADPVVEKPSRAERRAVRTLEKRTRRADARAAAVQQQIAAEAARAALDEQKRVAKAEKREARLDAKVSRKAAAAAKRERHAEEVAARKEAEAEARARRDDEKHATELAAAQERELRAQAEAARQAAEAEERQRVAEENAAREAAERERLEQEKAAREAAEAAERQRLAAESAAKAAADAAERERLEQERAAREAAEAAERERQASERAAKAAAEAAEHRRREEERAAQAAEEHRRRTEENAAREAEKAAARVRKIEEKAAREVAQAEERRRRAEEKVAQAKAAAEEQQRLAEEKAAREAEERRRREEERAAREAAEAEAAARERERRAVEQAARTAEQAAARAAEERQRLEGKLGRLEARATARADKDARRQARRGARADAKSMAEAEALDRRQDRRVRRIEKRRARADARSAAEIEDLERRRGKRARRLKKRADRAAAKARKESEQLERRRHEIERLVPDLPDGDREVTRLDQPAPPESPTESVPSSGTVIDAPAVDVPLVVHRSRRERRRDAALAKQLARVAMDATPTKDGTPREESLSDYLGRVEASILPWRSRRTRSRMPVRVRRTARIAAVCVLIGGAAVVPFLVPRVPGLIADAVPGTGSHVATIKDPAVGPRTNAVAGPVGIATETNPLDSKRLVSAGQPRRVQVQRLHVDSSVIPISGQSGSLLPPSDPQVLGWWREGAAVGSASGSAVITGHTVHTGGGALDDLDKLAVGDTIRVQTARGWVTYVVQRARIYSTAALARDASEIFRLSGPGRLVMITCDNWNGQIYESNAVVFASPTSDDPFDGEGVGHVPDPGPGSTS